MIAIMLVLTVNPNRVIKGPLATMLHGHSIPPHEEMQVRLPASIRAQLEALEHMLSTQCDEAQYQCCDVALKGLISIYRNVRHFANRHALQSGHLFRWFVALPPEYIQYDFSFVCNHVPRKYC